ATDGSIRVINTARIRSFSSPSNTILATGGRGWTGVSVTSVRPKGRVSLTGRSLSVVMIRLVSPPGVLRRPRLRLHRGRFAPADDLHCRALGGHGLVWVRRVGQRRRNVAGPGRPDARRPARPRGGGRPTRAGGNAAAQ